MSPVIFGAFLHHVFKPRPMFPGGLPVPFDQHLPAVGLNRLTLVIEKSYNYSTNVTSLRLAFKARFA
jgi:hypothetical protein